MCTGWLALTPRIPRGIFQRLLRREKGLGLWQVAHSYLLLPPRGVSLMYDLFTKGLLIAYFGITCFCRFLLLDRSNVKTFALVKANTMSSQSTSPLQANIYILCSSNHNPFNFP